MTTQNRRAGENIKADPAAIAARKNGGKIVQKVQEKEVKEKYKSGGPSPMKKER